MEDLRDPRILRDRLDPPARLTWLPGSVGWTRPPGAHEIGSRGLTSSAAGTPRLGSVHGESRRRGTRPRRRRYRRQVAASLDIDAAAPGEQRRREG